MDAQCELKAAGKPYPRTCPVCKFGPCQRMKTVRKGLVSLDEGAFIRRTVYGMDPSRALLIADDIDRVLPFLRDGVDVERTERLAQFARDLRDMERDDAD